MIYRWRDNTPDFYKKYDANIVGNELIELSSKNKGRVTSTVILCAARNVESPLHPLFMWDDSRAAELYRKNQARDLARSIVLVRSDKPAGHAQNKPFLSSVTVKHSNGDTHPSYVTTAQVYRDPALREQLAEKALRELRIWYDKYWDLRELDKLIEGIEEAWPESAAPLINGAVNA